jgi:hypothetical protein
MVGGAHGGSRKHAVSNSFEPTFPRVDNGVILEKGNRVVEYPTKSGTFRRSSLGHLQNGDLWHARGGGNGT